ncbi:hypothetical protein NMY22_g732 [Coprinellus aureogranulatus]|nr:hypothetical protein NMY22_g732 [Coprinellus aureogranulatus]
MDPGLWREAWPGVRISGDGRAQASLDFAGVAIYYQGWLWSQPTTFYARVDDMVPITLDLTDRGPGQGPVNATAVPTTAVTVIIATNLTETTHHLVLSKGDGQRDVIVGSFIYSTDNPHASSSSTSSAPARSSSPATNSASPGTPNLKILLPSVLGSAAFTLLVCLILFMLWSRRRRQVRFAADPWLEMPPKSHSEPKSALKRESSSGAKRTYPTGTGSPRKIWPWGSKGSVEGSRVSLANAKRGVPDEGDFGVVPVVPADLKGHLNWRIE